MTDGTARVVAVFAGSILCLSLGNILLASGTRAVAPGDLPGVGWHLPVGIILMILQFAGMLTLFAWGLDVSVVVPVFGLNFVVTALLGRAMLGEQVDWTRWLGILLVLAGVALIARSGLRTTAP